MVTLSLAVRYRRLNHCLLALICAAGGCRQTSCWNQQPCTTVMPPTGNFSNANAYYSGSLPTAETASGNTRPAVNLSPVGANTTTTQPARDTFQVASRLPQDAQPIRIVEGNNQNNATPLNMRGMVVHDGTHSTPWANSGTVGSATNNPWMSPNLRGANVVPPSVAQQPFSAQEGQWRSRSSYEATERR